MDMTSVQKKRHETGEASAADESSKSAKPRMTPEASRRLEQDVRRDLGLIRGSRRPKTTPEELPSSH